MRRTLSFAAALRRLPNEAKELGRKEWGDKRTRRLVGKGRADQAGPRIRRRAGFRNSERRIRNGRVGETARGGHEITDRRNSESRIRHDRVVETEPPNRIRT